MSSIRFDGVGFGYTDAADVLTNVNLHLSPGWTGVVGHELTTRTIRVAHGSASLYRAAYGEAAALWKAEREERQRDAALLNEQARRARRQLAEARQARAQAERSIRARPKSQRDSDGRSVNRKARAAKAEAGHAKRLGAMKTRTERAARERASIAFEREHCGEIHFRFEAAPQPVIACVDGFGTLAKDSRVHLQGDNGSGKTTLLRAIRDGANVPDERMLLLPQELDRDAREQLLDMARAQDREVRGRTMQLMSLLGVDPEKLLASELPSPGEARKLVIASGLARRVWCMLLDEPTNHLDLPSIERLERALIAYPGAMVLVSHDAAFAAATCDRAMLLS